MLNKLGIKDPNDMERSQKPHIAIVTLKIDIRSMNPDGSFDDQILGDNTLRQYGVFRKAQITTIGFSESDCISKTKTMLEKLNE